MSLHMSAAIHSCWPSCVPTPKSCPCALTPHRAPLVNLKKARPLFEDGKPSENTQAILKFCEEFENAGAQTHAFVEELQKLDLLMDGEVSIQQEGQEQPFIYRGFKMIDEAKVRELRGDTVRKLNQNGILALIHAHLFSLQLMREIFAVQVAQGKAPQVTELPST